MAADRSYAPPSSWLRRSLPFVALGAFLAVVVFTQVPIPPQQSEAALQTAVDGLAPVEVKASTEALQAAALPNATTEAPSSTSAEGGASAGEGRPDFWARESHPETQMPWWLVPVSSGFSTVGQYYVMGFDLPFKVKGRGTLDYVKQTVTCLVFVLLALNTWRVDIHRLSEVSGEQGWMAQQCVRLGLAMCSGNFLKSMALWGGFFIQAPKAALQLTPKYKEFGYVVGFPVSPCGAAWLNPFKWVYALVLLPYVIPIWCTQYLLQIGVLCGGCVAGLQWCFVCGPCKCLVRQLQWVFCACGPCKLCWKCCCKCLMCIQCWRACVAMCCLLRAILLVVVSFFGTFFTLALWSYPRDCMVYWANRVLHEQPTLALAFIILWSRLCPFLFTGVYSALTCGTSELGKAFKESNAQDDLEKMLGNSDEIDSSSVGQGSRSPLLKRGFTRAGAKKSVRSCIPMPHPEPLVLDPTAIEALKGRDKAYEEDFEGCAFTEQPPSVTFKAEKIAVVYKTLTHQQNITGLQLGSVLVLRIAMICLMGGIPTQQALMEVYIETLTERKWSLFKNTVVDAAVVKVQKSQQFHLFLHYLWTIL